MGCGTRRHYTVRLRDRTGILAVFTPNVLRIKGALPRAIIVGRVAAGMPLLAQENIEDMIHLPKDWAPAGAFLLKVQGNSMEGAHILDGDYVLVHPQETAVNGEIVVALIGDEATVKRFFRTDRGISLKAENPVYRPIEIERSEATAFKVIGKVMGVLRVMKK